MEEVLSSSSKSKSGQAAAAATTAGERKPRPRPEQKVECPRCKSGNTKFCYYNNYSMSQPRYFCKACRRYWTHGGSLRNVPIGGGCRKSKRPAASSDVQNKIDVASSSSEPPPMGTASACAGMMDFSNVLPAFMSGFELPGSLSLATFVSPSSSNPAAASGGMASFLDVLRGGAGGVHDGGHGQNNGYYYGAPAAGSGIGMLMTPPATSFGIAGALQQQHGGFETGGNGIGGATGTTFQGGEGDNSMRGMMGLQWQPQFGTANMGTANGGGGVGSQQMNTVNNNATTENNNNNNNGGGGGGEDDGGGSSRDYYWINNGGSSNPWQNLINSNSLM